jgi:hypothetical protein
MYFGTDVEAYEARRKQYTTVNGSMIPSTWIWGPGRNSCKSPVQVQITPVTSLCTDGPTALEVTRRLADRRAWCEDSPV